MHFQIAHTQQGIVHAGTTGNRFIGVDGFDGTLRA